MSAEEEEEAAAALATMKEDAGGSGAEAGEGVQVHGNMQVSSPAWSVFVEGSGSFSWRVCAVDDTPAAVSRLAPPFLRFAACARAVVVAVVLLFAAQFEDTETSRTPCGCCCGTGNFGVLLMLGRGRRQEWVPGWRMG
jgi:hypothetical protein